MPLEPCMNGVHTVSALWAHSEHRLNETYEWGVNAQHKRSAKVSAKLTVNALLRLCERFMNDLFGVPRDLFLHRVSSVIRKNITNKLHILFILGNPRFNMRHSSLHHPSVSLNFNARFSEKIYINIIQSNYSLQNWRSSGSGTSII